MIKRFKNFILRILGRKPKENNQYEKIMKELKKRDPFTYNH